MNHKESIRKDRADRARNLKEIIIESLNKHNIENYIIEDGNDVLVLDSESKIVRIVIGTTYDLDSRVTVTYAVEQYNVINEEIVFYGTNSANNPYVAAGILIRFIINEK